MDVIYKTLNDNYLILKKRQSNNHWFEGIVDIETGVEYIAPECHSIIYYKYAELIELRYNDHSELWHIEDLDKYAEYVKIKNEKFPF